MSKGKKKVNSVSVSIKGEDDVAKPKVARPKAEPVEKEEAVDPVILVSRLNHPITMSYNGEAFIIPPKGREKILNQQKLGAIPSGVQRLKA